MHIQLGKGGNEDITFKKCWKKTQVTAKLITFKNTSSLVCVGHTDTKSKVYLSNKGSKKQVETFNQYSK